MKKFVIVFFVTIAAVFANTPSKISPEAFENTPLEVITKSLATEMNKTFPKQTGDFSQSVQAHFTKNAVIIYKVVNSKSEAFQDIWKNSNKSYKLGMKKREEDMACEDPIMKYLISNKALLLNYRVFDLEKQFLFQFTVNKNDCIQDYNN